MATNSPPSWSELVPDLLSLVYKRLNFADVARARTVCSSWYSVLPQKNHIPGLIFKQDRDWKLYDPEEGKFYRTNISRLGFANYRSLATCGNWVLVSDNNAYLYIFNPFTLVTMHLPSLKSYHTSENHSFQFDHGFGRRRSVQVQTAILWVDERTKDYLVVWTSLNSDYLCFCRKEYEKWIKTPNEYLAEDECVNHMVYKDKKLYILTDNGRIKILDFSQDFPREVLNHPYINRPMFERDIYMRLTTSGDVLLIYYYRIGVTYIKQFEVYMMNSNTEEWEMVKLLDGEEALVWDFCNCYWDFGDDCHDSESSFLNVSTYKVLRDVIERGGDLLRGCEKQWLLPSFGFEE